MNDSTYRVSFSEDSDDSQDDTVVPFITLVRNRNVLPPSEFVDSIANDNLKNCHNLVFLLWLLNSPVHLNHEFLRSDRPFLLFSNCYSASGSHNYEEYLQIWPRFAKTGGDSADSFEVSVFPQALQFTKLDQFRMDKLTHQYTQQFGRILNSYSLQSSQQSSHYLRANLHALLQSYVYDTLFDLFFKWKSWSQITGRGFGLVSFSSLVGKFWDSYMCLQFDDSLQSLASTLNSKSDCKNFTQQPETDFTGCKSWRIRYAVWVDTANGIMLLINGVNGGNIGVVPAQGLDLTPRNVEQNISKLLLFVNMCLIECLSWELNGKTETGLYIKGG
ncbi:KLTH0C09328p [Lachancea thermotolerans CBS 6340]|uniref:KLTH0C09328p n=1 Tax=Lachancea thermotolerans (strain ATCC 56472 / CBS 6340 / NRRL Y-8284) TaxID=559295 RepID=C5DEH7_LACTC|nr:KLTH0C09328p [Lachancea thermotolerans CBS 6340]CAR22188.1 KLTH0C09328p [Lachancea thermotolerans CBS 6340]